MNGLQNTSQLVKEILTDCETARNSDSYLYLKVLQAVSKKTDCDIDNMPVTRFLLHMNEHKFPAFETVRRTRQKMQALHPELAGCDRVEAGRKLKEEEFIDYARRKWD